MKLIAGGAWQGKKEWIAAEGYGNLPSADGWKDSLDQAKKCPVVFHFHGYIRRMIDMGMEEEEILSFAASVAEENPQVILSMDEVGYGIVPMDEKERKYREYTGRAGQLLAGKADEVYRIVAGIGQRIK